MYKKTDAVKPKMLSKKGRLPHLGSGRWSTVHTLTRDTVSQVNNFTNLSLFEPSTPDTTLAPGGAGGQAEVGAAAAGQAEVGGGVAEGKREGELLRVARKLEREA